MNSFIQRENGLLQRLAAFLFFMAISLLLAGALSGCGSNDSSGNQSNPTNSQQQDASESSTQTEEQSVFLNQSFVVNASSVKNGASGIALATLDGKFTQFAETDWITDGQFASGRVLVQWTTSGSNQGQQQTNEVTHFALVDKDGKIAVDLTDRLNDLFGPMRNALGRTFVDDRLVFTDLSPIAGDKFIVAVLNPQGEVVFTAGPSGCTITCEPKSCDETYHDGVLTIHNSGSDMVVDTSGNVLAQGDTLTALGSGYLLNAKNGNTTVEDYSGNVVFDVNSINVSGDIENATIESKQPGAGGLLIIQADKINSQDKKKKTLYGLYSLPQNKWLVPLSEGFNKSTVSAHDGVIYFATAGKDYITQGYEAGNGVSLKTDDMIKYRCFMDYAGNIILDSESSELSHLKATSNTAFRPEYCTNGIWQIGVDTKSEYTFAYMPAGEFKAVEKSPLKLSGSYPNN